MKFNLYPFEKLRNLLKDSVPLKEGLNLSIGEPGFESPVGVIESIKKNANLIKYYPKLQDELVQSQINFVKDRFNVVLDSSQIIPTFGSREVLFNFPQFIFSNKKYIKGLKPRIAYPNPFYQIYEGAQIANNAKVIYMPLTRENNFKPKLKKHDLKKVDMVILNSPNNPTGQTLSMRELMKWVNLALKYDFILLNDECYSEIYEDRKPHSLLEASLNVGNKNFKNIFVVNSISKRISAPGLRSGFIAGDSSILKDYRIFRTYVGISMPLTLQEASIIAWSESEYAESVRKKFAANLQLARDIFQTRIFPYTFYAWLNVKDSDEVFTKKLYETTGHIVLPGSYLGRKMAGHGYVRIALTQEYEAMQKALQEIKENLFFI